MSKEKAGENSPHRLIVIIRENERVSSEFQRCQSIFLIVLTSILENERSCAHNDSLSSRFGNFQRTDVSFGYITYIGPSVRRRDERRGTESVSLSDGHQVKDIPTIQFVE
jgi:hypothetical protein